MGAQSRRTLFHGRQIETESDQREMSNIVVVPHHLNLAGGGGVTAHDGDANDASVCRVRIRSKGCMVKERTWFVHEQIRG